MLYLLTCLIQIALDIDRITSFTLPLFGCISLNALFDDVIGDYLFARSILLTTPTTANVGTSMTIPLALITDYLTYIFRVSGGGSGSGGGGDDVSSKENPLNSGSICGSMLVIIGFVIVNVGLDIEALYKRVRKVCESCYSYINS